MNDICQKDFTKILQKVAPGTYLRKGIDNIMEANTGGLIVIGDSPEVMALVSGGFNIDCEYTPARLYELAKMDGAIITNHEADRIIIANAQLDPDASIYSDETGIRHRTAERVAHQTGELVVAISKRRAIITLFKGTHTVRLRPLDSLIVRANQALQTLEKYRNVWQKELQRLSGLEFEDLVTVSDVCSVLQLCIRVLNIAGEIENYIEELGVEGRLVKMQLDEMIINIQEEAHYIIADYMQTKEKNSQETMQAMMKAFEEDVSDVLFIAKHLALGANSSHLGQQVAPRGYRMLHKLPRIPSLIIENLVDRFSLLSNITQASIEQLDDVEGIGEVRARSIKNGLRRMQEQLYLDYMK